MIDYMDKCIWIARKTRNGKLVMPKNGWHGYTEKDAKEALKQDYGKNHVPVRIRLEEIKPEKDTK